MEAGALTVGEERRLWASVKDAADRRPARDRDLIILGRPIVLVMVAAKGLHDVAETGLNGLSTGRDLRARRGRPDARLRDPQARQLRPRRLPHLRRLHGLPGQRHLGRCRSSSRSSSRCSSTAVLGIVTREGDVGADASARRRAAPAGADVDRARLPDPVQRSSSSGAPTSSGLDVDNTATVQVPRPLDRPHAADHDRHRLRRA